MAEKPIIETVKRYLKALSSSGLIPSFAVLFGSQVSGKTDEWSDIDLMVVARRFDKKYEHDDLAQLWKIAGRIDPRIEPIPCGEKQWEEDDGIPIIEIARREGEIIKI